MSKNQDMGFNGGPSKYGRGLNMDDDQYNQRPPSKTNDKFGGPSKNDFFS